MITKEQVMSALEHVYDIEIGYDVVSLGLIYKVNIAENNDIYVEMTLTTPMCPMAGFMVQEAKDKLKEEIKEANNVFVELTFDPPWSPDMAKDEVRQVLGI
ncbi:hypothetical protein OSSY52_11480 [Tepiditoga spiralis]|uniref:MIP18 family-like domain-containing protein n=1 Tax=Tepiditoga spiralis TaxID=2108365 RepID=A0A7G1G7T9_9BACT|nr:metal-sulfur cluster assembly factor [Tepiditoga spiralis]BBE31007.1 hypothetical protein OSSY52_11480 [Tepiditoga spiralis]